MSESFTPDPIHYKAVMDGQPSPVSSTDVVIASNEAKAAQGTQMVTGSIQAVREGAGQTGAAATQVLGAAQELARNSNTLGREVDSFLAGIEAA